MSWRIRLVLTILLTSFSIVRGARADELKAASTDDSSTTSAVPNVAEEPSAARTVWYGWQSLLADAGSIGLGVVVARALESPFAGVAVGTAGYAVTSPVIHGVHRDYGRAGASLALRLAAPALFAWLGVQLSGRGHVTCGEVDGCTRDSNYGAIAGGAVGGAFGVVTAVLIDAFALSWRAPSVRPSKAAAAPKAFGLSFVPTRGGATAGVHGSF